MTKRSWIRKLFTRPVTRTYRKMPHGARPALEALEDRTLLSLTPTAISVIASGPALFYGQTETLTATVTAPTGDPIPTSSDGLVTFYDGATALGAATLSGSPATATLTTSALLVGSHTITAAYSGDSAFAASRSGVEATSVQSVVPATGLSFPYGVGVDGEGDVFITDNTNHRVVEVKADGTQTTVGSGFRDPWGVAVDGNGDVFIADAGYTSVVEVKADGTQTTVGFGLLSPQGLAVDGAGNVFIADSGNSRVVEVRADGTQTTLGSGLNQPFGVGVDGKGDVFIADTGNGRVVEVDVGGTQTTVASGLSFPYGVAPDGTGDVFITDAIKGVVGLRADGTQTTVGSGLNQPFGVAVDGSGNVFIADTSNNRVVEVSAGVPVMVSPPPTAISVSASGAALLYGQTETLTATVTTPSGDAIPTSGDGAVTFYDGGMALGTATLSGSPATATLTTSALAVGSHSITAAYSGDSAFAASRSGIEATSVQSVVTGTFDPFGVAVDGTGDVFFAELANNQVVEVKADGTQTTVATGLNHPAGVAVDVNGDVFITDIGNNRVLEVKADGTQTTVASGLSIPEGVAVDRSGNVFIADTGNNRVLEVKADGTQTTFTSGLNQPTGVAVDGKGDVFIVDFGNNRLLEVKADGTQTTVASGLNGPFGAVVDGTGNVFTTDSGNNRVMEMKADGTQTTVDSQVNHPLGVALDGTGDLFIADNGNNRVVKVTAGVPVTVSEQLILSPTTLPNGTYGAAYSQIITATHGAGPYSFALTAGALPPGLSLTDGTLAGTPTGAGTYAFTVTATDAGGVTGSQTYNFVVNKADATVVVAPYSVTYDRNAHAATVASITGVNGETGTTVGNVTLNTTHTTAGTYGDIWNFVGGPNYNDIADTAITDVINKADATVVVTPYTVTYDGLFHQATVTTLLGVGGETGSAVGVVKLPAPERVAGTYSFSWSFLGSRNYNNASGTVTDVINLRPLTVTSNDASKIFGTQKIFTGTEFTQTGLVSGDTFALVTVNSIGAQRLAPVGSYPIAVTVFGTEMVNYTITYIDGTLTVTPAATTTVVTSSADPSVDGQDITFTATVGNSQTPGVPAGAVQFAVDGANIGAPVTLISRLGKGTATSPSIALAAAGSPHIVTVTYSDPAGNFIASNGTLSNGQVVNAVTAANLQTLLGTTSTPTLEAPTDTDLQTIISAINGLTPTTATITVNLGSGTFNDSTFSPPAGVTVLVIGNGTTTTFVGHSPALEVTQGSVSISGVTFSTATDAPAILVSGGTLILRNDVIQESSGFTDAAISVPGGMLDLGTTESPGGNILNINGLGEFVHNTTAGNVPATGNTYEVNGAAISAANLSFTALSSSGTSSIYGHAVTLTATVLGNTSGLGTLTGSVDFVDTTTGSDLGSVSISSGSAALATSALGAGDHLICATYSGDGNFTLSLDSLTQSVSKAALTITANNDSKDYGTLKSFGGTAFTQTGLVTANGDTITGVSETSTGTAATASVGTYDIAVSAATGTGLDNYTISYVKGSLTVNKKAIIFTIGNDSHFYGSTDNFATDLGTTFVTGVNGENLAIAYSSTGNTTTAAAGTYAITGVVSSGTGLASNYAVTLTNGTLTVLPSITVPAAQTAFQNVKQTISGISIGSGLTGNLTFTLAVGHGTLTLGTTTGLAVTGNGTGSVSLIGTTAKINAALATLSYQGLKNYSGSDTLNLTVTTGSLSSNASVAITVVSIAQQDAALVALVNTFLANKVLTAKQASTLLADLALQGNSGDIGKIGSFINDVNGLVNNHTLTKTQANTLLLPGNILLLSLQGAF